MNPSDSERSAQGADVQLAGAALAGKRSYMQRVGIRLARQD